MKITRRQAKPLNLEGIDPYNPSGLGRESVLVETAPAESPRRLADFDPSEHDRPPLRTRAERSAAAEPRKPRPAQRSGVSRHLYLAALAGGLVWAGCFIAFVLGFQRNVAPLTYAPFQAVILAMLTVLPAAFLLLAAYAMRQGAKLAAETRAAAELARQLTAPAALAAAETGDLLETMRQEIERAASAGRGAHEDLAVLSESLKAQTDRLTEAAADAQRTARVVGETLTQERDAVSSLLAGLQTGSQDISHAVQTQTRLVADASDLARSQLQEAEAALAARAADLTAASAAASASAHEAGEQLARETNHLDAAAAALAERLRLLDARFGEQRAGLAELVRSCDADQDDIAARLESRRAQLVDTITQARVGAAELGDASDRGTDALRVLIDAAAQQVDELVRTVETQRSTLEQQAADARAETEAGLARSIAALGDAAQEARRTTATHADEVQQAAGAHIEAAKSQVEHLGELAFNAGQKANQAFDARINEARRLIENSATLVEEAGLRSVARIDSGLAAARDAVASLGEALADIDAKMAKLPEDAQIQGQAMRAAVDRGVGDLATAARRVAEETQAIDAAFQERVRRNYETLSEAVRLMGRVASPAPAPASPTPTALPPTVSAPAASAPQAPSPPVASSPIASSAPPVVPAPTPSAATPSSAPSQPAVSAHEVGADTPASAPPRSNAPDFIPPQIIFERESLNGAASRPKRDTPPERKAAAFLNSRTRPAAPAPLPVFGRAGPRSTDDPGQPNGANGANGRIAEPQTPDEQMFDERAIDRQSVGGQSIDRKDVDGQGVDDRDADGAGDEILFETPRRQPQTAPPLPDQATGRLAASPPNGLEAGLRPRLRLTPTEADAALKTVFDPLQTRNRDVDDARGPAKPADGWEQDLDEWTWRDLLSSIEETPNGDDDLAEQMIGEISALGIDAGALLPRARLEEIIVAIRGEDPSSVRDSVRRLAPAAIRRLSRRVLTDKTLRDQADRYVRRYDSLVRGSVEHDKDAASTLLSSDPGRAYLLLDAAVGDLH